MLRRPPTRLAALASAAAFALALATSPAAQVDASPRLTDLHGVQELKALFNRDAGAYRLIVLLSPT